MHLRSPFGAIELRLERCDRDILAHPTSEELHDVWRVAPWQLPWLFAVRCLPDALVLNNDRSANIVLTRLQAWTPDMARRSATTGT